MGLSHPSSQAFSLMQSTVTLEKSHVMCIKICMTKLKWGYSRREGLGERFIRLLGKDIHKKQLFHHLAGNMRLATSACCQNLGQEMCN